MDAKRGTEVIRADDFVEYFLFPSLNDLNGNNSTEKLDNFLRDVNESVQKFSVDYIWHKEPFQLVVRTPETSRLFNESKIEDDLPPHLYGLTFYGENIQDEWFIVEIINHLTTIYPHLIGRVFDADGEFLLIEAAEVLPRWANPDTCAQRVFISSGRILLVQNDISSETDKNDVLPISVGVENVRENRHLYESNEIIKCIEQRFVNAKKSTLLHRACVYLPISAALLLKQNPQLISYAVRSFCNRDPIEMKICRAMKHFPPETRVYTQITFTKCLYALLTYHNYKPNQRTGWNLPDEKHETYAAHNLGMKIACGLEICASKAQNENEIDVVQSKGWQLFAKQLEQNGYYGDAIEGSQAYTQRFEAAKQYFRIVSENHSTFIDAVARDIHQHLKHMSTLHEQYKTDILSEFDSSLNDNEDWMNISQDDLDNMMNERYGIKKTLRCNTDDSQNDANDLGVNLNTFLQQKSEFDGVDFRPMLKDEAMTTTTTTRTTTAATNNTQNTGNNNIDFNADAFQAHLKDMLDFVIPEDNWDSHSDSMSDFDDENIERNIDMVANSNAATFSAYMEQMDRELAATTIGSSFKTKPNVSNANANGGDDDDGDDDEDFDDIESFEPVDIDVNAMKNLAESYKAQFGNHGPTSSLLSTLGMRLNTDSQKSANEKP
ncbi:protein ecdysoneless [Contarinia nasturtii]|uniref:protein ecdysoneless n=1 Tax=Contarinia nasturtii TaxID=265458 RepID=UPI0012D3A8E5|nr:protein ecdysoneless [Contarinia nasturtii]